MYARWNDFRYGLRAIYREPVFACLAILALALGIGANTAIFSMVNGILLRPLPYRQPGQLYIIREIVPRMGTQIPSWPANLRNFDIWQRETRSFEQMAVVEPVSMDMPLANEAREIDGARASANLFDVLGVTPQLGRNFLPGEDQPGRDGVVILTYPFWHEALHADASILNKTIILDGAPYLVIGVLPKTFRFPKSDELGARTQFSAQIAFFKPLGMSPNSFGLLGSFRFAAIARLKSGTNPTQALADVNVVQGHIASQVGSASGRPMELRAELLPLENEVVGSARRALILLLASVGAVLLLVCLNLASLLLARTSHRLRDVAIRSALGATQGRLVSQLLMETLPLALLGGALGIAVAYLALHWLIRYAPATLPRLDEVHLDASVLMFAFFLALISCVLAGILPAWRCSRGDPQRWLKSGGTTMTLDRPTRTAREVLVSVEVALTVVLLFLAGSLTMSLVRVLNTQKGFQAEGVLTVDVTLPTHKYKDPADRGAFFDQIRNDVSQLPGVRQAAWVSKLPLEGQALTLVVNVPGVVQESYENFMANYRLTSPDYFSAIGIPLLRGRTFDEGDRKKNVAVISKSVVRSIWPKEDPIGRVFHPGPDTAPLTEVIGVVGDIRTVRLDEAPLSMVYVPYWQMQAPMTASLVVHTATAVPASLAAAVRGEIQKKDSEVPILKIRTMNEVVSDSVSGRRFQMWLAQIFAGCALFLAALGIYGIVLSSVEQRRHELGIRLALGATPANIRRLVVARGMRPVALGALAGMGAALLAGRAVSSLLFGAGATDSGIAAGVSIAVCAVGVAACYVPAMRTARLDPARVLRNE